MRHLLATLLLTTAAFAEAVPEKTPVLLELFTSEGCSSCPPADEYLARLDRAQPVRGAQLIVISEHVDYWNHLGWADPFSQPQFSKRQQYYAEKLSSDSYTPQLVIDGQTELVGSNQRKAEQGIVTALKAPKIPITIRAAQKGHEAEVHFQIGPGAEGARLFLVLAIDRVHREVSRGENAGRTLSHTAVAESFKQVATISGHGASAIDVSVAMPMEAVEGKTRVIAFLQQPKTGHVVGAAEVRL